MQTAFGVPPPVFNFILISLRRQTASGCGSPGGGCAGAQVPPCPRRCPFQPPLGRVGSRLELLLGVTREEPRCVRPLPEAPQPRLPGGRWLGSMPPSPPWGVWPPGLQPRGASPFEDSKLTLVSALPAHVPPAVGAPRPPVLADCPRPCHRLAPGPNPGCGRDWYLPPAWHFRLRLLRTC